MKKLELKPLFFTLINNNGVEFLKLFFRSSLNSDELVKSQTNKDWVIKFSDGKQPLGEISIPASEWKDKEKIVKNETNMPSEKCPFGFVSFYLKPKLELEPSNVIVFSLRFDEDPNCGSCTAFIRAE